MPEPTVRPEVVALLTDIHIKPYEHFTTWKHYNGQPMTPEETELVGSANPAELHAVADYLQRKAEHEEEQTQAMGRIAEIARPYFQRLPDGSVLDDVVPLLTPDERAEYERLAELVAPDGTVTVPR